VPFGSKSCPWAYSYNVILSRVVKIGRLLYNLRKILFWPLEFLRDFTNFPLNFKISHFGFLNFELLSIKTIQLILAVKIQKKTKISIIFVFFLFLNKKNVLEVEILYRSQRYKCHVMFKI
jgi:hypothetical protein